MRDSCEESHDYAKGCAIGEKDKRGVGWVGVVAWTIGGIESLTRG